MRRIYLDNAASSPLNKNVQKMLRKLGRLQGNPQGMNLAALNSYALLVDARREVARAIGASEDEIFFTSGASESNALAKKLWKIESDPRVHDSLRTKTREDNRTETTLSKDELVRIAAKIVGCNTAKEAIEIKESLGSDREAVQLQVNHMLSNGKGIARGIKFDDGKPDDTVYAMSYINNETGYCDGLNCPFGRIFLDLTATIGHICVDLHKFPQVVGASFSGHKFGSLQGVGVLYIKKEEQEKMRKNLLPKSPWSLCGGTPNTIGIHSLGIAIKDACNGKLMAKRNQKIEKMILYIGDECARMKLKVQYYSYMVNITFNHLGAMSAVSMFRNMGIDISAGSACHSDSDKPSKVLLESGYSEDEALRTKSFNKSRIKFHKRIIILF